MPFGTLARIHPLAGSGPVPRPRIRGRSRWYGRSTPGMRRCSGSRGTARGDASGRCRLPRLRTVNGSSARAPPTGCTSSRPAGWGACRRAAFTPTGCPPGCSGHMRWAATGSLMSRWKQSGRWSLMISWASTQVPESSFGSRRPSGHSGGGSQTRPSSSAAPGCVIPPLTLTGSASGGSLPHPAEGSGAALSFSSELW